MIDLRSLILGQNDLPTTEITVPEWLDAEGKPLVLRVKSFTVQERDTLENDVLENRKLGIINIRAAMVARGVVDAEGKRVFSDKDAEALANKNGNAMNRLFDAVLAMNKVDVAALEKN